NEQGGEPSSLRSRPPAVEYPRLGCGAVSLVWAAKSVSTFFPTHPLTRMDPDFHSAPARAEFVGESAFQEHKAAGKRCAGVRSVCASDCPPAISAPALSRAERSSATAPRPPDTTR